MPYTLPGKGCYVAPKNVELLREENLKKIEEHVDKIVRLAAPGKTASKIVGKDEVARFEK